MNTLSCYKLLSTGDSGVSRVGLKGGFQKSQMQVADEGRCQ